MTSDSETTHDAFLGGKINLYQPKIGYRAGVDPVLLAASVPANPDQSVLELGCGVGAAMFCLGARVSGLSLCGVELQPDYADLARVNAKTNGFEATITTADLRTLPPEVTALTFDHVLANPPYFQEGAGKPSSGQDRNIALRGATKTKDWLDTAYRRLKHKGWLTLIQKADRLPEIIRDLDERFGAITVTPIVGRHGRDADRFILRARKGGMTPFVLTAPVALHNGPVHTTDKDDYTPQIADVLRNGAPFPFPD